MKPEGGPRANSFAQFCSKLLDHTAMTCLCTSPAKPIHVVSVDGSVDAVARRLDQVWDLLQNLPKE